MQKNVSLTLLAALLAAGCAQFGPHALEPARANYAQALGRSSAEQLLLNLVRLRYRDNPVFLEVGSVVTHYSLLRGASAGAKIATADTREGTLGATLSLSEDPTITYSPLQGEEFVKRLLTPIDPSVVVYLSQSGWSLEQLLMCCVQKANALRNATSAAGPTPDYVPDFSEFRALAHALRQLQVAGLLDIECADGKHMQLHLRPAELPELEHARNEVIRLLDLDPQAEVYTVLPALNRQRRDEIAFTGRSLLGTMYFLSQAVVVPPEDERAGLVTVTRRQGGERFDWNDLLGRLIAIRHAPAEPTNAAVRVSYRGGWFFIADDDLNSKSTFSLLTLLYSLKAGTKDAREPLLTLGVQ